ncbi:hypothetical protein [Micromonospora sp. NPDC004551]|uniref:hypothetical protein n=1 Tax=Micromonospora sp. NPDC004551 TaxID=3154284 RepID=UPI0033ACA550
MIPSLILLGLLLGRWWWLPLPLAAVGWPVLLVAIGTMDITPDLVAAAGLAVVNASVGVAVHQGILRSLRRLRPPIDRSARGR